MKAIITEDIVRNALNESIDEFIIEEGAFDGLKNWWNKGSGQYIKNGLSSAWKNAKNAAAMYMDKRTGGMWNQKYGVHATGSGVGVGHYYFNKWLENHYKKVYDLIWGEYYGNRECFYDENGYQFSHDWKQNSYTLFDRYRNCTYVLKLDRNGMPNTLDIFNGNYKIGSSTASTDNSKNDYSYEFNFSDYRYNKTIYLKEDETTPEEYIAKYCTPQSFERYTKNTLEDGNYKQAALNYLIDKVQKENPQLNDNQRLELLTIASFYGWWGKNMKSQQAEQPRQPQPTVSSKEQGQGENINFKFNPQQQNSNQSQPNANNKTNRLGQNYGKVPDLQHRGKFFPK